MTLLDRLLLVVLLVMFVWQVLVPLWCDRPVLPMLRKRKRGTIDSNDRSV